MFESPSTKSALQHRASIGLARGAVRRLREQSLVESALVFSFVSLSAVVLVNVLDVRVMPFYSALRHCVGALLRTL